MTYVKVTDKSGKPIDSANPFPASFYDSNGNELVVNSDGSINAKPVPKELVHLTATIEQSESLSDAVDLEAGTLAAIIMPAAWDAADLTFQASGNGEDFFDLYDEQAQEIAVDADADYYIRLIPPEWAGIRYIKVRSGTSGSPVTQADEREIILVTRVV